MTDEDNSLEPLWSSDDSEQTPVVLDLPNPPTKKKKREGFTNETE